jgi:hypothetical protein
MKVSGQLQGKNPWYPLDRRLGGLQSWSGGLDTVGKRKKSHHYTCWEIELYQPVA